jgi:predicted AlkP superfamily pyrophosphatase or phosphodiesterase
MSGRAALFALVVLALAAHACGGAEEPRPAPSAPMPRMLLLAIDGLEWDVALPLLRDGRMPELASLMERGTYGVLDTIAPTRSPVIWTTVATGKTKEKHGILGFDRPDPADPSRRRLYSNSDRRTKAFWNIATDYGRRVHVVGWFVTFPVEPLNGVMVAQTNTAPMEEVRAGRAIVKGGLVEGVPAQVYPPDRQPEMFEQLRASQRELPRLRRELFGELEEPVGSQALGLLEASEWAFRADATYEAIARKLATEEPRFDLMAVYIGGTDVVGHRFWRYMEPGQFAHPPSEHDVRSFGRVIPSYYAYADRVIGSLRGAAGEEVTVIVVSDHGMGPVNVHRRFEAGDRGLLARSGGHPRGTRPGMLVAAGSGIARAPGRASLGRLRREDLRTVGSVLDVAPTLLALLGIPTGEDMDGRVLADVIDPAFLAAHPLRTVATHDTEEFLASRPRTDRAAPDEEERIEQLRALGYVE